MELTVEVGREAWADRGDRRMPCSTRVGGGGRGGGSAAGSGRQEGAAATVMLEEEGSAAAAVPRAQANAAPLCARALAAQRQARGPSTGNGSQVPSRRQPPRPRAGQMGDGGVRPRQARSAQEAWADPPSLPAFRQASRLQEVASVVGQPQRRGRRSQEAGTPKPQKGRASEARDCRYSHGPHELHTAALRGAAQVRRGVCLAQKSHQVRGQPSL